MSGLWTLCSLFFPCPSWVCLFGYFPVLVKFIDYSTPVLVFLNYFPCVYKSWVLPVSLSVHSSLMLCTLSWLIKTKNIYLPAVSCVLPTTHDCDRWTDPFAEGWLQLRTLCRVCGRRVGGWNGMWGISSSTWIGSCFTPRREPPHTATTARTACSIPNTHPAIRGSSRRRSRLSHPALRGSSRRRSRLPQARRSREITPPFAAHPGPPFTGDHAAVCASAGPVQLSCVSAGPVQLRAARAPPRVRAFRAPPRVRAFRAPPRVRASWAAPRGGLPQENFLGGPYSHGQSGRAKGQGHGLTWPTMAAWVSGPAMVVRACLALKASRVSILA